MFFCHAHAPGRLLLPLCGNSPSVATKNDQDHCAPAGANFFGLHGVVQKILAKVRSGERAFLFFGGPRLEKGNFAPRAAARTTVTCRLTAARVIRTQKAA